MYVDSTNIKVYMFFFISVFMADEPDSRREFLCELFENMGFKRQSDWLHGASVYSNKIVYKKGAIRIEYGVGSRSGLGAILWVDMYSPSPGGEERKTRIYGSLMCRKRRSHREMLAMVLAKARKDTKIIREKLEERVFPI